MDHEMIGKIWVSTVAPIIQERLMWTKKVLFFALMKPQLPLSISNTLNVIAIKLAIKCQSKGMECNFQSILFNNVKLFLDSLWKRKKKINRH